ncbi:MAG TPA: helix-turn-helix domain-containing protein [Polyangia bacterium]|nr:helix-turn-helix domain-containing protein [Polyangia bacterium]
MSKKTSPQGALFVRLPAAAVDKLDRAAEALGMRKKDLVAGLVSKYVDPDSESGRSALGSLSTHKLAGGHGAALQGSYSFQPFEAAEVLNAAQAGQFLQIDEATVIELAEAGELPGRKLAGAWRFSRSALVAWLSVPRKK